MAFIPSSATTASTATLRQRTLAKMEHEAVARECLPVLLELHASGALSSETLYDELAAAAPTAADVDGVAVSECHEVQRLWGGMGAVLELTLRTATGAAAPLILKRVELPALGCTSVGDRRKEASYVVEQAFYERGHAAALRALGADVPLPLLTRREGRTMTTAMTKLSGAAAGGLGEAQCQAVMRWMARLHARYWGAARADAAVAGGGLQAQGSYWYLETRRDEWDRMSGRGWEGRLKRAAAGIDAALKAASMQGVVHGDAKAANMLFRPDGEVQMYDFQYVGKAPPAKDLAYVVMCAATTAEEGATRALLRYYLAQLSPLLEAQGDAPPPFEALWDAYLLSVADLGRWMAGWGWWGNRGMDEIIQGVLDRLDGGQALASEEQYADAARREFGHI